MTITSTKPRQSRTASNRPGVFLRQVIDRLAESDPFRQLIEQLQKQPRSDITGLSGSATAMVIAALIEKQTGPTLIVAQKSEEALDLYEDLSFLLGDELVGHFPARQILPYDFKAPVGEVIGKRISTLAGMTQNRLKAIICPVRGMMEPTIPIEILKQSMISFKTGDEVDIDELSDRLVHLGFRRVPLVEEVGDFARRGGVIDFFTPGSDAPVRVELFGDEIDTIREFEVATQRSTERLDQVQIMPKREIPIIDDNLEKYLGRINEEDADYIRNRYFNDPDLPGLEWLSVMFGMEQGNLTDYLPANAMLILSGSGSLKAESEAIMEEAERLRSRLKERFNQLITPDQYYWSYDSNLERLASLPQVNLLPFKGGREEVINFECQPHPSLSARFDLLEKHLTDYETRGWTYFIAADQAGQMERLKELLADKTDLEHDVPVEVANLKGGFICKPAGIAILTDHEIFSRYHRRVRKRKFKEGVAIADYSSLTKGDYVVHTDYGVARYLGLETIEVDDRHRDCLLLQYDESDRLYVPIEEFNRVAKYSGKEASPKLTCLGGPAWEKLKSKTKKAIADMAEELIKLYAKRKASGGFSFGEDSVWLKQLEASFPFTETPDQAKAILDVKRDMAREEPMDRLVCGDVGYGKTEVAVRAAFKAIDAGKQVAVLVPTTILALQHFNTFKERLAQFPVKVEMLSRFRKRKEQLEIIAELANGKVDLVIGTHRLFSKDVKFKDIGLLIIDEEHRFGVRHKEKLRQIKTAVDTMAMTATPIPRTLQMSMMGVRDMSIIATSPKGRLPIITETIEFDPAIIATVILREIDRGGQVFFVHNRVQSIDAIYLYLKKLLPQVEFGIAHGQMHERSLEGIMIGFLNQQFQVLLCTAIIESGLDIPSANTIIINRADHFGLAQLYQLRGRVGRSERRAYCYLVTPPARLLKPESVQRLRALEAHSDLGSGFALAMRDLEIRGAGTILGAKQSGFIEEIGFDMYNRLLEEAVAELKGQEIIKLPETKIETALELHLPTGYVPDSQQKVDLYRRLADCRNLDEVERIRDEVIDRFGRLPQSGTNLFDAAAVKISAARLQIEKVAFRPDKVHLIFEAGRQLKRSEIESFRKSTDRPLEFSVIGNMSITIGLAGLAREKHMPTIRGLLNQIV